MKAGVYKLSFNGTDKFYIGSATNLKARERGHRSDLNKGKHHNILVDRCYKKYGDFNFNVLEYVNLWDCPVSNVLLLNREQFYIDSLNPELNICRVAGNCYGRKVSDKTKRKIAESSRGRVQSFKTKIKISKASRGRKHTEKSKHKIRESKIGDKNPMYGKRGVDSPNYGRIHAKEVRQRMSESMKGKLSGNKNPMYGKRGKDSPNYGKKRGERERKNISNGAKEVHRRMSKLSIDDIAKIRELSNRGISNSEIAKIYQMSRQGIYGITTFRTWKDV